MLCRLAADGTYVTDLLLLKGYAAGRHAGQFLDLLRPAAGAVVDERRQPVVIEEAKKLKKVLKRLHVF